MANPTQYLFVPGINFREVGLGATYNITLFEGGLRPTTGAARALHAVQNQGTESSGFVRKPFSGGTSVVAATATLTYVGSTLNEFTQNVVIFPMTVNSLADEIFIIGITPASANLGAITAKVKEVFTDGLAGTMPTASDGYIFSKNNASRAQISTALQAYFGADPDVACDMTEVNEADDSLLFTATTVGTDGNFQQVITAVQGGASNIAFTLGDNAEPIITGVGKGRSVGLVKDFTDNQTPNVVDVDADNTLFIAGSGITGLGSEGSFNLRQSQNAMYQALLSNSNLAFSANYNEIMAGDPNLRMFGMVVVQQSKVIQGQFNVDVFYEVVFTGGRQRNLAKDGEPGLPISFRALPADTSDPLGVSFLFRQF